MYRIYPLLYLLFSFIISGIGCGRTGENSEANEDNLEAQEELDIPFFGGVQSTLKMIQGDAVIGDGFSDGRDSIHVIADFLGKGEEWDIVCVKSAQNMIRLTVGIGQQSSMISGIGGLASGVLPRGGILEIAAAPVTDGYRLDLLCAVGDGISNATLSVFQTTRDRESPFVRVGLLEGETTFRIRGVGIVEAPVGVQGLSRIYVWNGTTFEETQEDLL